MIPQPLRTVHHIYGEDGWHVGVTDRRQDEFLRIEFNLPLNLPLCTAVHKPSDLPGYTFVVHGVALAHGDRSFVDQAGRRWYICEDGSRFEVHAEHPVILHEACLYVDDEGHQWTHVPYPSNFSLLCAEGRVIRSIALAVWGIQILRDDSHVFAERRWHPTLGGRDFIGGLERSNNERDVELARRSFKLFDNLNLLRGGRRRLEDSPSSPWRAFAEQARELLATKEIKTIREAAQRLMVDYDSLGDDSIAIARAERAAEVRLGNYLRKLRALDE